MNKRRHGIRYTNAGDEYFAKRGLQKYAGVWSLWALGVGAVISGHYSGWNLGLASGGWGGMFVATVIIAVMYLGLTFSIAEMSPALPHTGAAYSFARTAMGPWGGFITGLCENVEYVLTPAVIVFFIGSYLTGLFETSDAFQPIWWICGYILFVGLNIIGVELSFKVTVVVTLAALAVLAIFWALAIPNIEFGRWALNIGSDELVTINQLVDMVEAIAGIKLNRQHNLDAPKGVNGRNSDNTLIKQYLGWAPDTRLRDGMEKTYAWIHDEYMAKYGAGVTSA